MLATLSPIPTYAQGLARHRGESAYPESWDGLVGLWPPLLGPTGLKVFNYSLHGQAHNGTLTGMDPATDWVGSRYGWALDLPISAGYVDCGTPSALAISGRPNISVLALIKLHWLVAYGGIWDNSQGGGLTTIRFGFNVRDDRLRLLVGDGTAYSDFYSNANVLSAGTWLYVGVTVSANNEIIFYCDGAACGTATLDRDLAPSTASWKIGIPFMYGSYGLNGLMAILAVYDRVLPPSTIRRLCSAPAAPLRLRRRVPSRIPGIGGPYRLMAAETFHTGAAEGEVFSTGSLIGECDGPSG